MERQGGKRDQQGKRQETRQGKKKRKPKAMVQLRYDTTMIQLQSTKKKSFFSYQIHVPESQSSILCCLSSIIGQVCQQKGSFFNFSSCLLKLTNTSWQVKKKNAPSNAIAHARNPTRHWDMALSRKGMTAVIASSSTQRISDIRNRKTAVQLCVTGLEPSPLAPVCIYYSKKWLCLGISYPSIVAFF